MGKNSVSEEKLHTANARIQKLEAELRENEQAFQELLSYSEVSYFVYYPRLHRYEAPYMPDPIKEVPTSMDNYPEAFMKYNEP